MQLFLVRHGECNSYEKGRRQKPDSPLSKIGKKQAGLVAKRFKKENIDLIISSSWTRAFQTARVISETTGIHLETFDWVHERKQHPKLYGVKFESKIHNKYLSEIIKNNDLDWKFRGKGESLRDVIKRAQKLERHLVKKHLGQNILLVSHGIFIRCFLGIAILGRGYDDTSFMNFYRALSFNNTGVNLLKYDEEQKRWNLRYLNDHHHLNKLQKVVLAC